MVRKSSNFTVLHLFPSRNDIHVLNTGMIRRPERAAGMKDTLTIQKIYKKTSFKTVTSKTEQRGDNIRNKWFAIYVFLSAIYVFLLEEAMYSYCCLCILIFVYVFLFLVYVFLLLIYIFLLLSMYSYCCLCILIVSLCILIVSLCIHTVVYVFLNAATLTEVFPHFFLSCKANARL